MIKPVIYLSDLKHVHVVDIHEIVLLKAQRSYCKVILQNGETITHSKPLGLIAKELPSELFLRIGQSNIINRNHILKIDKSNKWVKLTGNNEVAYPMKTNELLSLLGIVISGDRTACRETL